MFEWSLRANDTCQVGGGRVATFETDCKLAESKTIVAKHGPEHSAQNVQNFLSFFSPEANVDAVAVAHCQRSHQ